MIPLTVKEVKLAFGQLTRLMRTREKLSQADLAEKLSLSRITIQNLESGKHGNADNLLLVMQYFGWLEDFHQLIQTKLENNRYESLY